MRADVLRRSGGRNRLIAAAVVAGLAAASLAGCATAPAAKPAVTANADTGKAAAFQDPAAAASAPTSTATPTRIIIPSIKVNASLERLARDAQGTLLPPHELMQAGWYAKGTTPGQVGPAVIAGHVDWVKTIAVFHRLKELGAGDTITVELSDGSSVHFVVTKTETVSKFAFPTQAVYGPTPDPELRVITCGGPWDEARDIYSDNVVVFATQQS